MDGSYKKLWHLLIDRGMKKRELCEQAEISTSSLAKLGKCETALRRNNEVNAET